MAVDISEDEVIVTLSAIDPSGLSYPQRRLLLSKNKPSMFIGRASKRNKDLEPRMYNGWLDSPVMSRDHAELTLDTTSNTVFIKDVGSLHGTYLNDSILRRTQAQALKNGDVVKFGISIDRANDKYPQCIMRVGLTTFSTSNETAQTATFQVPDESDVDDFTGLSDDDSDEDLHHGLSALSENGLRPKAALGCATSDPIDLTSEPDCESSWVDEPDSTSESSDGLLFNEPTTTINIQNEDWDAAEAVRMTDGFAPAAKYTESRLETEHAIDASYDGALQESNLAPQQMSGGEEKATSPYVPAIIETVQSVRKAETLGGLTGKAEYFRAREHNKVLAQTTDPISETDAGSGPVHEASEQVLSGECGFVADECAVACESPAVEDHDAVVEVPDTMDFEDFSLPEMEEPYDEPPPPEVVIDMGPLQKRKSRKRKLEAMSELVSDEIANINTPESDRNPSAQEHQSPERAGGNRAPNGLRRVAEVFGYAALGGAAVVSALIATAPNF